jgi:hypothetical protein
MRRKRRRIRKEVGRGWSDDEKESSISLEKKRWRRKKNQTS